MQINLTYDAQAMTAPQSFRDGIQAAADLMGKAFIDNITLNFVVGYGENQGVAVGALSANASATLVPIFYKDVVTVLTLHAQSDDDLQAVASLEPATGLQASAVYKISTAEGKAL